MRKQKLEKKKFIIGIFLLLILFLGIGYAILTEQLKIESNISYDSMKWDVGFKNAAAAGGTVNSIPEISNDKKTITIACNVGKSTESETCITTATIENGSTFDIELMNAPTITYEDTYIQSVDIAWSSDSTSVDKLDTIPSQLEREMTIIITTRELTEDMLPSVKTSQPVEITMTWTELSDDGSKDLPSYWKTYLDSKIEEINTKTKNTGTNSDSFIFITDQHLDGNTDYSSAIVNYITKKTSIKKVVFGGDILQGSQNDKTIMSEYKSSFNENLFITPIRGNHDATGNLDEDTYYNIMLEPLEGKIENNDKLYYHYDNEFLKIRYIFTDSISGGQTNLISNEQINWMKTKILELESDWTVLIVHHGIWTGSEQNIDLTMSAEGEKVVKALDEVYDQAKCTIAGVYTGHTHRDYYKQTEKGYFLVSTKLDASSSELTKYDPKNPTRKTGTTEEQTLDIVFVNPGNKSVETIRIGTGNNRVFNYNKNNYTTKTTDITNEFTWNEGIINITENGAYRNEYGDLWLYSNAVDVSAYKSITFTHIQTTSYATTAGYAFYDESGNFISGSSNYGVSYAPVEKTIYVPTNAKYFRTMWMNTRHSNYNEELHNIDSKFKCYGNEVVISNNADITSQFEWTAGSIKYSTGVASEEYSDSWLYSNAVDVSAYKSITFTHIQTTSYATTSGYAFYDKDGNFIIGGSNYGSSYAPVEKTIYVPTNAKYFRTMWMNTSNSNYSVELHNIDSKFKCYGNTVAVSDNEDITSQFEWTAGSIQHSTGVASEEFSDTWLYSNAVDVSAYKSITFTHIQTTNKTTPLGYAFYDENQAYISGATNGGTSYNPTIKTITVPSNAKYFRTMWINTTNASYNSASHDINTVFKCYGNK